MTLHHFNVPATIIAGKNASNELVPQLLRIGANRILFVTDSFMVASGRTARFLDALSEAGIQATLFDGVQPDPTDANVLDGLTAYQAAQCQAVVAFGGGSPMDAAKAIAILTTNPLPLSNYQGYHQVPKPGAPLIVIPTTAGTGSEVTKVAVITDTLRDVKMMMLDSHLLPTVALVDYENTLTMPPSLTAHVGVDTLTHGIEAYVSRKANPFTDPLALQCIALVAHHLEKAYREPSDEKAREGMMLAATLGGMAFSNSSVALVHGMSRPLGAIFHVPHGLSNAVLLPAVTRFSIRGAISRYATVSRTIRLCGQDTTDENAAALLVPALEALNQKLRIPSLAHCARSDRERFDSVKRKMATDALSSGSPANNPVVPTVDEIVQLYDQIWYDLSVT